jgi:hypothetical protein
MVSLFAYAYCVGERSSRGIERRCREDVAFRVICANQAPDHATIARFRVRHEAARGDELPEGLRTPSGRRAWLREAKEELERERAERPEPVPRDRAQRLETCRRRLTEDWRAERQANEAYERYRARGVMRDGRPFGSPPKP